MATSGAAARASSATTCRSLWDTEHHLIVTHEVTNTGSDRAQTCQPSHRRRKAFLVLTISMSSPNRGYFNSTEISGMRASRQSRWTLPKPMTSGAKSDGRFGKQDFIYLPTEDV